MLTSVDGYYEAPGQTANSIGNNVGVDWNPYVFQLFEEADTLLFGHVTIYNMMAAYWPTATNDPISEKMKSLPKIVFSKTLNHADWTTLRIEGPTRWLR